MQFYYWTPIISFLLFVIILSVRIYQLRKKGVFVRTGKKKKSAIFLYPIFLMMLILWLSEITRPLFPQYYSLLPESITKLLVDFVFMKVLGIAIIILSIITFILALLHFKNSLRFGLNKNNRGELITTGIFSFSRNPFFLSLDTYFFGIAILLPNLFLIGFALLAFVSVHLFILKEEKFMMKVYGGEYENYRQKTRRYF